MEQKQAELIMGSFSSPSSPAARPAGRRWRRITIRGLMVLVLVVGGPLGWMARRASIQRQAVADIRAASGVVIYDYQIGAENGRRRFSRSAEPPGPAWLHRAIGVETFQQVAEIQLGSHRGPAPGVPRDAFPAMLACTNLQDLAVNRVAWDDRTLERLGSLRGLRSVALRHTAATGAVLATLRELPELDEVSSQTEDGSLRATDLRHLAGMTQLRHLFLIGFHGLQPADLDPIRKLSRLETLRLSVSPVDDRFLAGLGSLGRLEQVDLRQTHVTDASLQLLARLPRLWSLRADGASITDAGMVALGSIRGMLYLELDSDQPGRFTDEGLTQLGNLKNLGCLTLNAGSVTANGLIQLLQALPELPTLSLSGLRPEHRPLLPILVARSSTSALNLGGPGVTDTWVPILTTAPAPDHLTLSRTAVTDTGAALLAAHPCLSSLNLDETELTDAGLGALARAPRLGILSIRGAKVSEAGIAAFRAARPTVLLETGPPWPPSVRPPLSGYR